MQGNQMKRIDGIDAIRCTAVICVILCHVVVGDIYEFNIEYMNALTLCSRLFAFCIFTIGRLGVPLFLLMTGYLMLDREYDEHSCMNFWKNKWFGLLIALECWIVIYHCFICWFYNQDIVIETVIKEMLFLKPLSMNHTWYMPMILGMYLLLPIISNALIKVNSKTILFPYIIVFISAFIVPTLNVFARANGRDIGSSIISDGFTGGEYGVYIITGYLLKRGILKKIHSVKIGIICGISYVLSVVTQLYAYSHGVIYNIWYDNAFLIICGICVFELFLRIKKVPLKKYCSLIANYSFAIYLVHNPINLLMKRYSDEVVSRPLRVACVGILTLAGSVLISFLISRIPKIGKKILYMR